MVHQKNVAAIMPEDLLGSIRVVLCSTSHPGNIGSTARAIKTMGLHQLVLVAPRHWPHADAETMAAGAVDILHQAMVVSHLSEALADCCTAVALTARRRDLGPRFSSARKTAEDLINIMRHEAWRTDETGTNIQTTDKHVPVALVFGNETSGLSNAELQLCARAAYIPGHPSFSSLNLGAAAQVMAYECRMAAFAAAQRSAPQPGQATLQETPPARRGEVEMFYQHLQRVMARSGFYNPQSPKRLLPKLRRLFDRAVLRQEEVNILRGILSEVEHYLPDHHESS